MPKRPVAANDPSHPLPSHAEAAFNALQAERDALRASSISRINLDVPRVVSMILGALPRLQPMADSIAALVEPRAIRGLEQYALAALFAHLRAMPAPKSIQQRVAGEAKALRRTLLRDAEALAERGVLNPKAIEAIRKGSGYVDLAGDLIALASLFVVAREKVAGKTPVTDEELARAQALAPVLMAAAARPGTDETSTHARDQRVRAFALLVRAYGQVRRAVSFLRWDEGDADRLAPPLHAARAPRRARAPSPAHEP